MKILCEYAQSAPHYVRTGWGRALAAAGHRFLFWDRRGQSAFDVFSEQEPDLFIGTTYELDRATCKCIAARPKLRVALFASAWGPLVDTIDRSHYPIVVASDEEKERLRRLKQETGRPDFVFIHVTEKYLEETMGGWRGIGIEPVGVLNAADTFVYADARSRPELACDVFFCGGMWPYKGKNLERYLYPLCQSDLRVRIAGNGAWPVGHYVGLMSDEDVRDSFASALVCPNVSEPHSTDYNFDLVERVFKVPAAGGFLVSDHVGELREVFAEDEVLTARSPEEMGRLVRHFVSRPQERHDFIQRARRKVLLEHTYFDRAAQFFGALGLEEDRAHVLSVKAEHVGGHLA